MTDYWDEPVYADVDREARADWRDERSDDYDAPTAAEAERDLAVDRGEVPDYADELRAGLGGWGEK